LRYANLVTVSRLVRDGFSSGVSYRGDQGTRRGELSILEISTLIRGVSSQARVLTVISLAALHFFRRRQTGRAMGTTQDKAHEVKDTASDMTNRAMGRSHDAKEVTKGRAYAAEDTSSDATGGAMEKGRGTEEATRDKA
jgi:hypothetical protein